MPKEADHKSLILNSILVTYILFYFINSNGKYMASLMSTPWLPSRDPGNVGPRSLTIALLSSVVDSPVPQNWAPWENRSTGIGGSTTLWTYHHSPLRDPHPTESLFGPWLMCGNTDYFSITLSKCTFCVGTLYLIIGWEKCVCEVLLSHIFICGTTLRNFHYLFLIQDSREPVRLILREFLCKTRWVAYAYH